jgi:hypothetical protein
MGRNCLKLTVLLCALTGDVSGAERLFDDLTADTITLEESGCFHLLLDEELPQWRQCGPGRFVVTNGVAFGVGGMGLWWYTGQQFTNFVLRGEFKQEQEIANSGILLRFPDPQDDPWVAVLKGHKIQIGDREPKDPGWRTGSIYPFQASTRTNTLPIGQWNTYEIRCIGHRYTVSINGAKVTDWVDPKERTAHGFIGLQNSDDGKTVQHGHVRIKVLP